MLMDGLWSACRGPEWDPQYQGSSLELPRPSRHCGPPPVPPCRRFQQQSFDGFKLVFVVDAVRLLLNMPRVFMSTCVGQGAGFWLPPPSLSFATHSV